MISTSDLAAARWVPILDLGGARFYQCAEFPDVYRRHRYVDGGVETRYACDDEVVATLGDIVSKMNADVSCGYTVGDDARGIGTDD